MCDILKDDKIFWKTEYDRRTGVLKSASSTYVKGAFEIELEYLNWSRPDSENQFIRIVPKLFSRHYNKWMKMDRIEIRELNNDVVLKIINDWIFIFQQSVA